MAGTFDCFRMKNIIWFYAYRKKLLVKLPDNKFVIIYTIQQYHLVAKRYPGIREHLTCGLCFWRDFSRVVEMCIYKHGVIFFQNIDEVPCDPLGQSNRCPCAKTDYFDMGDGPQFFKHPLDHLVRCK